MKANGWIILLLLGGAVAGMLGLGLAWRQAHWRDSFTKTPAVVTESDMVSSPIGGYRSAITYQYAFDGKQRTGRRFAPLPVFGSVGWARRMERQYPSRQSISVYVNPDDPAQAFLHPTSLFYPYALMLVGLSMLAVAWTLARRRAVVESLPEVDSSDTHHWLAIKARANPLNEAMLASGLALAYLGLCTAMIAHYWFALGPDYDRLAWFSPMFFIAGLVWLRAANRRMIAASSLAPATLETALAQPTLDMPIIARVNLQPQRPVLLREAKLSLVCLRRRNGRTTRIYINSQTIAENQHLAKAENLTLETSFDIPEIKRRPSRVDAESQIRWQFEIHVCRPSSADLITIFPITARAEHGPNPSKQAQPKRASASRPQPSTAQAHLHHSTQGTLAGATTPH